MVKKQMLKLKCGFTLAEMMVVIAIIGVIAIILLPAARNIIPYQEAIIFKKAYYNTKYIVEELFNDEDLYPKYYSNTSDPLANNNNFNDFRNESAVTVDGRIYGGSRKFVDLFASRMDITTDNIRCIGAAGEQNTCSFITPRDNILWTFTGNGFTRRGFTILTIDTDGRNRGPNCSISNDCPKPDTFTIMINMNGSITPRGILEQQIINSAIPHINILED